MLIVLQEMSLKIKNMEKIKNDTGLGHITM